MTPEQAKKLAPYADQFEAILDKVEESNPFSVKMVMDLLADSVGVWLINIRWLHPEIRKVDPNERLRGCISMRGKRTEPPVNWNGWYGDD